VTLETPAGLSGCAAKKSMPLIVQSYLGLMMPNSSPGKSASALTEVVTAPGDEAAEAEACFRIRGK
jgi:hypothetical protein